MTFVALEDVLGSVGVEPRQRKNALSFREKPAQLDDNGPGLERNAPCSSLPWAARPDAQGHTLSEVVPQHRGV